MVFFIQVFYIDYGNSEFVDIGDIFEWHDICNNIPFQAVLCKIAKIRRLLGQMMPNTNEEEVTEAIFNYLNNKFVHAFCKVNVL